jgi:UDP-N-acetylmuramoyl-L-alanyl-D-glutamate--2,6-diaminopimelate ligase
MKLSMLLAGVKLLGQNLRDDPEIDGICYSSKEAGPQMLFVAISGYHADGHQFISEAMKRGAAAVLCERAPAQEKIPYLQVEDARAAMAQIAARFYGYPARRLTILGVTGTNGKTTTTYLLKAMLEEVLGARVGLIGTNQNLIGNQVLPAARTTPESLDLQHLLAQMAEAGCTYVVMEVSSHALVLHRVDGILFERAIFTNLTQDHLDFHKTMEGYRAAKGRLFAQCKKAVYNLDDEAGRFYLDQDICPAITYSENKNEADVMAKNIRLFPDRVEFEAVTLEDIGRIELPIPGGFTIYNALGVIACGLSLGLSLSQIGHGLKHAGGVKGRIEVVPLKADFIVLIDYAHTPDALENILMTVRKFTKGRVLLLFGCGGDRDRSKRPIMGAIGAELSDFVMVTSDNPRTEPPERIIADILVGMKEFSTPHQVEPDRKRAIRAVLDLARPGDTVVLAGKGHELYQIVGTEQRHLDEREEVAAWAAGRDENKSKGKSENII